MNEIEAQLKKDGYNLIVGIDEAGRGPLAGPVVAAAVIIVNKNILLDVKDSKKISPKKRLQLYELIWKNAHVGIGISCPREIDNINILQATLVAMKRSIISMPIKPEVGLIDGNKKIPDLSIPQYAIVKGDSLVLSIAAASIIAKVTRDRIMEKYHQQYPAYEFTKHKGYPTKKHLLALKKLGPTNIHRYSFQGVIRGDVV